MNRDVPLELKQLHMLLWHLFCSQSSLLHWWEQCQDFCLKSIQLFCWTFSSCRTLKKQQPNSSSHTQIPHQGHNEGLPKSRLSFCFYVFTRAPLRPHPVFITTSEGGKIRGDIPTMSAPYTQNSEAEQRQNKASCNCASKIVLYFHFYFKIHESGTQTNMKLIIVCKLPTSWRLL